MTDSSTSSSVRIALDKIRRDGGTQPRAQLNEDTVAEYAEAMADGAKFPDVTVFYDGSAYWLADGFHRAAAAERIFKKDIDAFVLPGSQRDAILHSCGVNAEHGLRRTNEDKRRAVERLMRDEEWALWSDRKIARACGVSNGFVSNIRRELSVYSTQIDQPATRKVERGGTEYEMTLAAKPTDGPRAPGGPDEWKAAAKTIIVDRLAGGREHRNILSRACREQGIGEGYFSLALHDLLKAGNVTADGMIYRLIQPDSPNADIASRIVELLRGEVVPLNANVIADKLHLKNEATFHALGLLQAEKPPRVRHVAGGFVAIEPEPAVSDQPGEAPQAHPELSEDAPVLLADPARAEVVRPIDLIDPATAEVTQVPAIPDELRAKFNADLITLLGDWDAGAFHRAKEVARRLVAVGRWDGQSRIEFDAVALHNRLFGVEHCKPENLREGVDFFIVPPATAAPAPELPADTRRKAIIRKFADGSILTVKPADGAAGYTAIVLMPSGDRFVGWGERRVEAVEQALNLMPEPDAAPGSRVQMDGRFYQAATMLRDNLLSALRAAALLADLPVPDWYTLADGPQALTLLESLLDAYEIAMPDDPLRPIMLAHTKLGLMRKAARAALVVA